jgi:FtsZ-binding cell division protein ZapB
MSDILTKIRCTVPCQVQDAKSGCHCAEARDTITALRAEVETLTQALREEQAGIVSQQRESDALRAENERLKAALHEYRRTFIRAALEEKT